MKKWAKKIWIYIFTGLFVCSAALLLAIGCSKGGNMGKYKNDTGEDVKPGELAENPINWDKLKGTDAYAWVNVPGTLVDYPVAVAPKGEDEDFYLHHNLKRHFDFAGIIYSRRANHTDFSDPLTVLYGHNMRNGSMFGSLNRFESKNFLKQHKTIYIYMPKKILKYQIVSSGCSDNRDLLDVYDYQTRDGMQKYVKDLSQSAGYVNTGVEINIDSKFLVLSTCTSRSSERRLVQAVLMNCEETK